MKQFLKTYAAGIVTAYHYMLPLLGALLNWFPAREMTIILITGTKGKTSTTEICAAILRASGKKTAWTNSVRFVIDGVEERNQERMSMPGRFFLQSFLRRARHAGCTHAVIEATSEGARQFRHRFLYPDSLIVTNLAPEHIESHGSFDNYKEAKLTIADSLKNSPKQPRFLVVNAEDEHAHSFIERAPVEHVLTYSLKELRDRITTDGGSVFVSNGTRFETKLPGVFSVYNIASCITLARAMGIKDEAIQRGVFSCDYIPGRAERIDEGQPYTVIVDYAHTIESLVAVYSTFKGKYTIGILGKMGGGRDTKSRPRFGKTAEEWCDDVILTDEDPCDEDPEKIIADIAAGMTHMQPTIIVSRRDAIREGIRRAHARGAHAVVLITGKGTDPWIYRAHGEKEPWSDAQEARDAIRALQTL